jgi:hypothetical protein
MVEKETNRHSPEESLSSQSNSERLFKKAFGLGLTPPADPLIRRAKFQIESQEYDQAHQTLKLTHSPNLLVADTYIQLSTIKIGEGSTYGALLLLNEAAAIVKKTFASDPYGLGPQVALTDVVKGFAKMGELDSILSFFNKIKRHIDYEDEVSSAAQDLAENGYEMQAIQAASLLEEKKKPSVLRRIENIKLRKDDTEFVKKFRDLDGTSENAKLCALLAKSELAFESGNVEYARELLSLFTNESSYGMHGIAIFNLGKEFINFAVGKMGEVDLGLKFLDKRKPDIKTINAYCDVAKAQFFSGDIDGAKETVNLSKAKLGEMLESKHLESYKFDAELDIIATQIEIGEKDKAFDRLDQLAPELAKEDLYVLIGELSNRGNIDLIPFLINLSNESMTDERVILTRNLIHAGRLSEAKEQLEVIYSTFNSTIGECRSKISEGGEPSVLSGIARASFLYSELSSIHQKLGDMSKAQEMAGYHYEFIRGLRGVISEEEYKRAMWRVSENVFRIDDSEMMKQVALEFKPGAERSEFYNYLARNLKGEEALQALTRAEEEADRIDDRQAIKKSSAYLSISNSYYKIEGVQRIYGSQ